MSSLFLLYVGLLSVVLSLMTSVVLGPKEEVRWSVARSVPSHLFVLSKSVSSVVYACRNRPPFGRYGSHPDRPDRSHSPFPFFQASRSSTVVKLHCLLCVTVETLFVVFLVWSGCQDPCGLSFHTLCTRPTYPYRWFQGLVSSPAAVPRSRVRLRKVFVYD